MARIKRLSYRTGFVERLAEAAHLPHLPAITFEAADLPEDVVALVDAHLLDLGGTYGEPNAGDPIQYDELRIEHDQGDVEIVVYNRAIPLFDRQRGGEADSPGVLPARVDAGRSAVTCRNGDRSLLAGTQPFNSASAAGESGCRRARRVSR